MNRHKLSQMETRLRTFEENVALKYQIFNGLFLGLPFNKVDEAGSSLLLFAKRCTEGLAAGQSSIQIVEDYLARLKLLKRQQIDLLFKFLQFIERQVVLFDALEDAAFSQVNDLSGVGTLDYLLNQIFCDDSGKAAYLDQMLNYYKVRVVLTAHPTQFYPKSILGIIVNLGKAIKDNDIAEIRNLFLQMGLTNFKYKAKPTPLDEARSLIWYLEQVFYQDFPIIQKKLPADNINLEIGFWPGGDRDGNPFVTSEVTLAVAVKLRSSIINLYFKDIQQLRDRLTFAGIYERLTAIASKVKLDEYPTSLALIEDLVQIIAVLERDYQSLFVDLVQDLILKIRMFNFYFAKLDIRQNSTIHKQVIAVMLKEHNVSFDYLSLSNQEKIALLKANLANLELITTQYQDPLVNEVLQTFKAIYQIQKINGAAAIERYIISNTDSTASIFEVVFLIKLTNNYLSKIVQVPDDELIKLKVVPLFETIDDLKKAELIMEYLYSEPIYRQDLLQQQSMQTIMLGFSDGTKDGGYLRANWSIYLAKKKLTQVSHKHDIHVVFFDGRGGPPSRGGGNTYAFYHSLGTETEAREIQLTIQGQTISSNFGTTDSAIYNMEQLFTAGLVAKLFPSPTETLNAAQEELLEELAEVCYQAYLALRQDELFIPYLEDITPLKYLAAVNIGSRPAKRNSGNRLKLEDLRAIPFVGSWMQMQQNILGFYGLGIGMQSLINKNPTYLLKLQALYHDSLFFKTLINNAMESLYKSNFSISSHLAHDPKFGRFWHQLKDEYELAKTMLLLISGQSELLATDYVKRESIKLRAKIKLPLLIIQQYALAKLRDPQLQDKEIWEKLITKSLAANVNASRNAI